MPTGTLVLPDEADVLQGVQYGADGTEFTGTLLAMPDPGDNKLLARLQQIVRQLNGLGLLETVTYYPRTTDDTYGAGESWSARRLPQTSADAAGLAVDTAAWALYRVGGQTNKPDRLGKIVDAAGQTWHVRSAERGYGDYHFRCTCTLAVE